MCLFLWTGCAQQPPQLTLPRLSISDPSLKKVLEGFTGAPISGDNKVDILLNGNETFPVLLDELRAAKQTITFEAFIFRRSAIGENIVTIFEERCRAGVRASILLDAHGSEEFPKDYGDRLKEAGCQLVAEFRPKTIWNLEKTNKRNHRRVVVVDGRIGITGGYGIDESWSGDGLTKGHWRETNVRLEGPVVQQLQEAFIEHWKEATTVVLGGDEYLAYAAVTINDGPVQAQIVRSSPTRDNYALYEVFLQAIMSAKQSILISTPYLILDDQMKSALVEAVQRGVSIRVLVPSVIREAWVEYMVQETQREDFGALLDAGIEIYEYAPALLHTKAMTIDGVWSTVGSMNFDNRSMALNDELNVIFYSATIATRVEEILEEDLTHSRIVSRESLEDRSWFGRIVGTLMTPFASQF
ncbi:cardiolipin synthase B [Nitrospira sp.]|nr:cardiolipin synthase B [Nitrospira sp.]